MPAQPDHQSHEPWNKGKLIGQKLPLKLKEIWAIRVRLQLAKQTRELAMFNLAIDSKLRACDLMQLRVRDVCHGALVASRAIMMQRKTQQPVQFEITPQTREAISAWIDQAGLRSEDFLFPSRTRRSKHLSRRQYARIVRAWVASIGLDCSSYATHSCDELSRRSIIAGPETFARSSFYSATDTVRRTCGFAT